MDFFFGKQGCLYFTIPLGVYIPPIPHTPSYYNEESKQFNYLFKIQVQIQVSEQNPMKFEINPSEEYISPKMAYN